MTDRRVAQLRRSVLAVVVALLSAVAAAQSPPPVTESVPARPRIDEAACERLPVAPSPRETDDLPSRGQAGSFPVDSVRRILNQETTDKVTRVKHVLAKQRPVLFTLADPDLGTLVGDLWESTKDPAPSGVSSRRTACTNAMVVVGYDDSIYGGAFEIMRDCGISTYREASFWMRYEDFNTLATCAVELVGASTAAGNGAS